MSLNKFASGHWAVVRNKIENSFGKVYVGSFEVRFDRTNQGDHGDGSQVA